MTNTLPTKQGRHLENLEKENSGMLNFLIAEVYMAFGEQNHPEENRFISKKIRKTFANEKPEFIMQAIDDGMTGLYGNYGKPNLITITSWIRKAIVERNSKAV